MDRLEYPYLINFELGPSLFDNTILKEKAIINCYSAPSKILQNLSPAFMTALKPHSDEKQLFLERSANVLLVRKCFEVSNLPATPEENFASAARHDLRAACSGPVAAALGLMGAMNLTPTAFRSENSGELAVSLSPSRNDDGSTTDKSIKSLSGHTDAFFHAMPFDRDRDEVSAPPDYVVLIGLRNPKKSPTTVIPLNLVRKHLRPRFADLLRHPAFTATPQSSFFPDLSGRCVTGVSILEAGPNGLEVRFSHKNVHVSDSHGLNQVDYLDAIDKFKSAIPNARKALVLEHGDIAFIDNRTALHGRATIDERPGPEARWLLRMYAHRESSRRIVNTANDWVLHP